MNLKPTGSYTGCSSAIDSGNSDYPSMYWFCVVTLKSSNMCARNSKVGRLLGLAFQHSSMIL